mmetsp:Transcript_21780/g.42870  ORF Transcript_21780/g.42870 Transcript_21780/m.42870 type:complete len:309 (+) Transcript_21780:324-1250(+)|eukprot:CAMPEP_0171502264 /NCGR_PEP_ID=MMETSP0958-20121227/10067_1 /TAXON_ID=87120 /ORGANISM="Aurantiochytrium limacinum, Strain ATCCMYA-1381" /LENGTH=308 /DNA_ID=CAMNT_0012037271 /DNA_START=218 /DNA_END=1144 /DNA_ORIENTATION=+
MPLPGEPESVVVHPLVLLSVVDHYNRVARDTKKRVVGVLLGSTFKGRVDISNSFAVPFEEDMKDPSIWYLDHSFLENMFDMFRKVNASERIVGFYSSGPKIRQNDLHLDALFRRYCPNPVLVIVDIRPEVQGVPTQAYYSVEEVNDKKETVRTFKHIDSLIEAYEAEEVGVEHLLRDINDPTVSTLASRVAHKMEGLQGLKSRLEEMHAYMDAVVKGELPVNNQVIYNMQDIFNLLPNLNVEALVKSYFVKINDIHLVVYLSSLIRSIIALHNLLNNKLKYKDYENKKSSQVAKEHSSTEKTKAAVSH